MIYLDNAATSYPKPTEVYEAYKNALVKYGANPGRAGYDMSMETAEKIFETRENVSSFFNGGSPENVVFTLNCTMALNMAFKSKVRRGAHIIISDMEHNSVYRQVHKLKEKGIIDYSVFKMHPYDKNKTVNSFKSQLRRNTEIAIITHSSNVFGFVNPIKEIGDICRKKGICFILDAAQTAGIIDIDIKYNNINYLCTAGHKSLMGVMGTGILICNDPGSKNSIIEGGTGSASLLPRQPDYMPDFFEAGTLNVPGIISLNEGIKFIKSTGIETIRNREKAHILRLNFELKNMKNILLYQPFERMENFTPIISFNVKNMKSEEVSELLNKSEIAVRSGLHCAPLAHKKMGTLNTGTVRISPSYFTTEDDINCALCSIKNLN